MKIVEGDIVQLLVVGVCSLELYADELIRCDASAAINGTSFDCLICFLVFVVVIFCRVIHLAIEVTAHDFISVFAFVLIRFLNAAS